MTIKTAVAEIATENGGSITGAELRALGATPMVVRWMVRTGFLHRVRRDHFLVGHRSPSIQGDRFSKVAQAGREACLSSTSAIDHLGFLPWTPTVTDIVVPRPRRPIEGVRQKVHRALLDDGRTTHRGLPTLSPAHAVLAASMHLTSSSICRIIREGRFRRVLDVSDLERVAATSIRGAVPLRSALAMSQSGDGGHRSKLELDVGEALAADVRAGSIANGVIHVCGEDMEVDRVWYDLMICQEVDGPPHDDPVQQKIDRIRRALLRSRGWLVEVTHWRDFERDPHGSVSSLERVVRAARAAVASLDDSVVCDT